jgi:hypothetical protein
MRRYKLTVTTDVSGNATAVTPRLAGKIHSVIYVADGTNPYAATVDFTITALATGENIWTQANVTASTIVYPRAQTHSQAGVPALYAASGTGILDKIGIQGDQVQVALVQGGATKVGVFHVLVD